MRMNRKTRIAIEIAAAVMIAVVITVFFPPSASFAVSVRNYSYDNQIERALEGDELTQVVNIIKSAAYYSAKPDDTDVFNYDYGVYLNGRLYLAEFAGQPYIMDTETGNIYSVTSAQMDTLRGVIDAKSDEK